MVAVVNFPKKQIGPIQSECLVTGFHDSDAGVVLCVPDTDVPLGTKLLNLKKKNPSSAWVFLWKSLI